MNVFISYSHKDKEIIDFIDKSFFRIGIQIIRDVRDAENYEKLGKFAERIKESDYVLMYISDSFLKSSNCMLEVIELVKDSKYDNRLIPILDKSAIHIRNPKIIFDYVTYWKKEGDELNAKILGTDVRGNAAEILKSVGKYDDFSAKIAAFLTVIVEMKTVNFSDLQKSGFQEILDRINFKRPKMDGSKLAGEEYINGEHISPRLKKYTAGLNVDNCMTLALCPNLESPWSIDDILWIKDSDKYKLASNEQSEYEEYFAKNKKDKRFFDDNVKYMIKKTPSVYSDSPTPLLEVKQTKYSEVQYYKDNYSEDESQSSILIEEVKEGNISFPHSLCLHCIIETNDNKVLFTKRSPSVSYHPNW
ncbi:MAG: toll/interleukin-1 receptor domain-containing protein [Candidatus Marithrix sp.]